MGRPSKRIPLPVLSKCELFLNFLFDRDEKDTVPRSKAVFQVPESGLKYGYTVWQGA